MSTHEYSMPESRALVTPAIPWREIALFTGLAYALSWLWWGLLLTLGVPLVPDLSQLGAESQGVRMLIVVGDFGPLIAALLLRLFVSKEGLRGSMGWRRSWRYYTVALLAPPLFFGLLAILNHLTGLGRIAWTGSDMPLGVYLVIQLPSSSLIISLFVLGEEYGWRGYLLPRLLPLGEVRATFLVGLIWAFWHLPLLLLGVTYPGQSPWLAIPLFTAIVILLSFPFTWFYRATGGSVILAALLHGSINAFGDGLSAPELVPQANPLLVGSAGLVTGLALLLLVLAVYGLGRRPFATSARDR
jgi:membrane protease YdiL (CAAX protease family)